MLNNVVRFLAEQRALRQPLPFWETRTTHKLLALNQSKQSLKPVKAEDI